MSTYRHSWVYATTVLCCYGFFKEMKPSEPFLNPYLTSPKWKNFSNDVTDNKIYPVWTYSYMGALFIVLLITDYLLYRPLIMLESLAYLSTRVLLIWGSTVEQMQLMQFVYGIASATEIAYYSYIYAVVPDEHYRKVTSFTRMAVLLGRTVGWYAGQILFDTGALSLYHLNFVSFASVGVACVVTLFLPAVPVDGINSRCPEVHQCIAGCGKLKETVVTLGRGFVQTYSDKSLLRWSLWWAIATCGEFQVGNFVQNLWEEIDVKKDLNGYAQATATLAGFFVALAVAYCRMNWNVWGEMVLGVVSVGDAAVLFWMSQSSNVIVAYVLFLVFRVSYTLLITVATYEIAQRMEKQLYGLVFGCNMFVALVMQTILTFVLVDSSGPLHVSIRTQFVVISGYFFIIGCIFTGRGVYRITQVGCIRSVKNYLWVRPQARDPCVEDDDANIQNSDDSVELLKQ